MGRSRQKMSNRGEILGRGSQTVVQHRTMRLQRTTTGRPIEMQQLYSSLPSLFFSHRGRSGIDGRCTLMRRSLMPFYYVVACDSEGVAAIQSEFSRFMSHSVVSTKLLRLLKSQYKPGIMRLKIFLFGTCSHRVRLKEAHLLNNATRSQRLTQIKMTTFHFDHVLYLCNLPSTTQQPILMKSPKWPVCVALCYWN